MNCYAKRIQELRTIMKSQNIDAYFILTSDPHLGEYLPKYWKNREWISGFSGSSGTIVITQDYAGLWSDGRYWLQAQKELQGSTIELQKQDSTNNFIQWILTNLQQDSILGTNFQVLPLNLQKELESHLKNKKIQLHHADLLRQIWKDRPALITNPIYEHTQSPRTRTEKILKIRQNMRELKASHHFISTLDDIAWICNLRGSDISYNPVFLSYMLISHDEAILWADLEKIPPQISTNLSKDGLTLRSYYEIESFLKTLQNNDILIDPSKTTAFFANILQKQNRILEGDNPSILLKSCKSDLEIAQIEQAMLQDGIALCNFLQWLEDSLKKEECISELDIDSKLQEFRSQHESYVSDSFATIAAFNANAALPHYRATQQSFSYLDGEGLLLIDSGAQYTNGTTDITRVIPIRNITPAQKRDYTLVLKAHIALSSATFPLDIPMPLLDSITRAPLWKEQIDFIHGTGHGVGYFLNVHEGPQVISYFSKDLYKTKAKVGMITSIEPGIYRANQWGIRLENLVVSEPIDTPKEVQFGDFLHFRTLTLCPFENSCIDSTLLTQEEKKWLNTYHAKVWQELESKLEDKTRLWLKQKTAPLK
ncbi:MAG: aminopeptidase P family protein [Helicobacter sp.]|nr:aminopeptidase P family protein [Helicobacter sp.]